MKIRAIAAALSLAVWPAAAQTQPQTPRVGPPPATGASFFVVVNKAGPHFDKASESVERARAHQQLYRSFEADGRLIVGGAMAGETPLGVSVFCPDVDRAAIRTALENDQIVRDGVLALEFREWRIQMGALAHRCAADG